MKQTALTPVHRNMGAKMVEFAGYEMPIQYTNLLEEHHAVRTRAGIFDVSHMGEFMIEGPQALHLIQFVTSNDASKLQPGQVQYSCLPNDQGGIVDDLLVYCIHPEKYMLVVNASNIDKDWNWIKKYNDRFGANMKNVSDEISLLAVQGPLATEILQQLTPVNLSEIPYYHFTIGEFNKSKDIILSNTGYTGAGGFEIYLPNAAAESAWNDILEAGKSKGLIPAGLGARDTLRLEMAFCLYGNDIDDHTSPIEAGLGWITKFTKDFVNRASLEKQKQEGTARKLVGFELLDKGIPRKGYTLHNAEGKQIGVVTSGTQSPSLNKPIGMGYVETAYAKVGTEFYVEIRNKQLKARVVKTPFYQK